MDARFDHVLATAARLSAHERAALVVALLDSLEGGADASVPQAWRAELRHCREQLRVGATSAVPWEEARACLGAM